MFEPISSVVVFNGVSLTTLDHSETQLDFLVRLDLTCPSHPLIKGVTCVGSHRCDQVIAMPVISQVLRILLCASCSKHLFGQL